MPLRTKGVNKKNTLVFYQVAHDTDLVNFTCK